MTTILVTASLPINALSVIEKAAEAVNLTSKCQAMHHDTGFHVGGNGKIGTRVQISYIPYEVVGSPIRAGTSLETVQAEITISAQTDWKENTKTLAAADRIIETWAGVEVQVYLGDSVISLEDFRKAVYR